MKRTTTSSLKLLGPSLLLMLASCSTGHHDHHGHEHGADGHGHEEGHGHDEGRDHDDSDTHDDGAHEHAHQGAGRDPGPNGGRVLASVEPHAEFLVTDDRRVQVTFLDGDGRPTPAGDQVVTVIAGERANPTTLAFVQEDGVLLSNGTLPKGSAFPTIVKIASEGGAEPVIEKFNLDLSECPGCSRSEYACTCGA